MHIAFDHVLFAIGVCFLASLVIGRWTARLRVPRVTGYLVVGLLAGPSLSHLLGYPVLISHELLDFVKIISDVSLAFIMLTIGRQFKFVSLRKWGNRLAKLSSVEMIATFVLVAVSIFVFNEFVFGIVLQKSLGLFGSSLYLALFTGVIAVATAPAATVMVIREYESEGQVTDLTLSLIGLNNFISILFFNLLVYLLLNNNGNFGHLMISMFGPVLLGFIAGMLISIWAQSADTRTEFLMLLLGGVVANIGLSWYWNLDIYLSCFVTGLTIVNASPKERSLFEALRSVDYPLYVFFFIIAGASLHIEMLAHIGLLGIVYIIARSAAKVFGNKFGARWGNFSYIEQRWLGLAMVAQAGVAIGLSQSLARQWPEGGQMVQTVILGSVVFFELVGPISVRQALVHAGEVPLLTLLAKKAREGTYEGLHNVIDQFRTSVGIPKGHNVNSAHDIMVQHIMRKNVETLFEDTAFNEILHQISHSKYDRFPIINKTNQFIGVIDYKDIRDILFDESLAKFIVARDLVKPEPLALFPEQTLGEVLEIFQQNSNVTYLPIIDGRNKATLLGIVSQNDVLAAFRNIKTDS